MAAFHQGAAGADDDKLKGGIHKSQPALGFFRPAGKDAGMTPAPYRPRRDILTLGADFYDVVEAAHFPRHILRYRNNRAAAQVGLLSLTDDEWVRHFGAFESLPDNLEQRLALRYHGHQFRFYNPDLGDGRGFLHAQLLDDRDRLMDLGTKGSGTTPWSRFGDGRLTLKGGVREILAAEMLEALGVSTSRGFSLVETGEYLERNDEPSPTRSSVLVRLSHGHIRFGTFERLATLGQPENIRKLTLYVLKHLARIEPGEAPELTLMSHVVAGAARLVSQWHVAGFVHGVLNTDNMSLTSESFDYGPWRFLPRFDAGFTAAYFDSQGLYAFGRQAEAVHWNLVRLANALAPALEADGVDIQKLVPCIEPFADHVADAYRRQALWRLGLQSRDAGTDTDLIKHFETGLTASGIQPDRAWFDFRGGRVPADAHPAFAPFVTALATFSPAPDALTHPYWNDPAPVTMLIEDVETLWSAIADDDDWQPFYAAIAAIRRMGAAHV